MSKKAILLIPALGAAIALIAVVSRRGSAPETPNDKRSAPVASASAATESRPASRPAAPAVEVKSVSAAEQGQILHQAALDQRVRVMVRAAMSGDRVTADVLRQSLLRSPVESRPVVRERLAKAELPREKEILQDLLRQLP